jgi:di/tricarboxylate transporter
MFCGMASISVSSALWLTATSANPIGVSLAAEHGLQVSFGSWLLVASVPSMAAIGSLPPLFASSYFSTLTPQGGSQNVTFVASGYLTQGELDRLGLLTTVFCVLVFLVVGTPWILWVG